MSYGFIFLDSSVLAKTMDDKFLILCIFSPDETENTDMKEMERAWEDGILVPVREVVAGLVW